MTYQYQSINELPLSVLPKAAAEYLIRTKLYSFKRGFSKLLVVITLLGVLAFLGMFTLPSQWHIPCFLLLIFFFLSGLVVIDRNTVKSIDPEAKGSVLKLLSMREQIRKETCQDILHRYGLSQLDPTQIPALFSQYDELRQSMLSKWSAQLSELTFSVKKQRVINLLSAMAALLFAILQEHISFDFLLDVSSVQDALLPLAELFLVFSFIWLVMIAAINSLFQLIFMLRDAVVKPGSLREHIHTFLSAWIWYGPKREPEGEDAGRND